jgi:hypothetical protein
LTAYARAGHNGSSVLAILARSGDRRTVEKNACVFWGFAYNGNHNETGARPMTDSQKARLVDLIDSYGTYQYMLGKGYEKMDENLDEMTWRYRKVKEICQQLLDEYGIRLHDLEIL